MRVVAVLGLCLLLLLADVSSAHTGGEVSGFQDKQGGANNQPLLNLVVSQALQLQQLGSQLQQQSSQIQQLSEDLKQVKGAHPKQVAFSVRYNVHEKIINVGSGGTLKFPEVITNIGKAYSPLTGHFTAPCAGTYALYGSLRSSNTYKWIALAIYKGATGLVEYTAEGNVDHWDRGSGLVTTHLAKGQIVYVRQAYGGTHLEAGPFTTFSGMLVAAD